MWEDARPPKEPLLLTLVLEPKGSDRKIRFKMREPLLFEGDLSQTPTS